jgi:hypothetical protein
MNPITLTYDIVNDLKLDLYLPDTEIPPLFVYMHGGGLESGSRTDPRVLFERLEKDKIAVASIDYRMYPQVKYPVFIEDCARALDFIINKSGYKFSKIYVGGSSAGAYLSMMLCFDKSFLSTYDIDPMSFDGWVFDAGQPTVHFNILKERGFDPKLVRIDEAAPLYHITEKFIPTRDDGKLPMLLIITASADLPCRPEQLRLLDVTLKHFGWPKERIRFIYMNGYAHCGYIGQPVFADIIESIISK